MSLSVAASAAVLAGAAVVSLGASALFVLRLERVAARLGFTEALLGMVAALAADSPEITSAISALSRGQHDVGVGVVLGSNVFNLAALLGLGALVAGRIALHRRVVVLTGGIGLWVAVVAVLMVEGAVGAVGALVLAALPLVPYVAVAASPGLLRRWRVPGRRWVAGAIGEEEAELSPAIHPRRGGAPDAVLAVALLVVVVAASVAMERTATTVGDHFRIPSIVVGGVVLAAVTSMPNAVTAVYLARRGRGAAVLSEAMNSNTVNVVAGLLLPAVILGTGGAGSDGVYVAAWSLGLTALALVLCFAGRGLTRWSGSVVVVLYAVFVASLVLR